MPIPYTQHQGKAEGTCGPSVSFSPLGSSPQPLSDGCKLLKVCSTAKRDSAASNTRADKGVEEPTGQQRTPGAVCTELQQCLHGAAVSLKAVLVQGQQ